jgi:hypothetical protein
MKRYFPLTHTLLFAVMCVAFLVASSVRAGDVPTRNTVGAAITSAAGSATTAVYTVPAYGNGQLLSVRLYDSTRETAATCTVYHVQAVTSTRSITNSLGTIVSASSTGTLAPTGAYIVPGDKLLFTMAAGNTGQVAIVRSVANP